MGSYYKPGTWNAICDVCGFEYKSDEMKKRWDGLMVCPQDFEHRHPMDFMRVRSETLSVPWTRPEADDTFIDGPTCTIEGRQGIAGYGTADCATVGYIMPS